MNDRYLCKAKRIDNGEWVVGLLWKKKYNSDKIFISCFPDKDDNEEVFGIDPNTICQCTGLNDKNGKLIWEGDICIIRDGTLDEEDGYFRLDWEDDRAMFEFEGTGLCVNFDNVYVYECEVIGNAIDNPELLEVEE